MAIRDLDKNQLGQGMRLGMTLEVLPFTFLGGTERVKGTHSSCAMPIENDTSDLSQNLSGALINPEAVDVQTGAVLSKYLRPYAAHRPCNCLEKKKVNGGTSRDPFEIK